MEIQSNLPHVEFQTLDKSEVEKHMKIKEYTSAGACVKALVDSGVTKLPEMFKYPSKYLAQSADVSIPFQLPVIDLTGIESYHRRAEVVAGIREAGENWGFFQLVNHGVPSKILEEMLDAIRRYNEQSTEAKMEWQLRDRTGTFQNFHKNMPAIPWRDTLAFDLPGGQVTDEAVHPICRKATRDYIQYVISLKETLFKLVSEALALKRDFFVTKGFNKSVYMTGHYYPPCPEPELTMGGVSHTDLGFMTILLQDNSGGFQVLHQNHWLDVPPVPGSLLVNFGDFMQLMTNAEFKSVRHQILATRGASPRISLACFINPASSDYDKIIGPAEELISEENPPIYKATTGTEYRARFLLQMQDPTLPTLAHFMVSSCLKSADLNV